MKIIFLDIDGVLNSELYYKLEESKLCPFNKESLRLLKKLVYETGAKIVLTSTWKSIPKNKPEYVQLTMALWLNDLVIYDETKELLGTRDIEIQEWLSNHSDIENFVILDDWFFGDWAKENLVQTQWFGGWGFTKEHYYKALKILNNL